MLSENNTQQSETNINNGVIEESSDVIVNESILEPATEKANELTVSWEKVSKDRTKNRFVMKGGDEIRYKNIRMLLY